MTKENIISGLQKGFSLFMFMARKVQGESLSFFAGGVAFYAMLSVFPAMTALVSLYGLMWDASDVQRQMAIVRNFLPDDAYDILYKQLVSVVSVSAHSLSLTVTVGFVITLLSASRAVKAIMAAMNYVYRIHEQRRWWERNLIAYGFTLGSIGVMILSILLLVALPIIVKLLHMPDVVVEEIWVLRWIVLSSVIVIGLTLLFRYAPARKPKKGHWLSMVVGAVTASVLWLFSSYGFTEFVESFPAFNRIYGSLGALVVLMIWFYLSAYAVIIGAAVNASLEEYFDI